MSEEIDLTSILLKGKKGEKEVTEKTENMPPEPKVEGVKAESKSELETTTQEIKLPEHEEEGIKRVEELNILEEEITAPPKLIITIYGEKGTGKTTNAMGFKNKVLVLSFDDKSAIVKYNMYNNDARIKVFSPIKYWDRTDKDKIPENAKKVWNALVTLIKKVGEDWKPDWIVVDAVEEFEKLIEQVMRYDYGLGPYDGIANRNIWKYRKDLFMSFLALATKYAKYGVIFTTYPDYSEHISQGEVVSRKPVPKWADYLQLVTDVVIYTYIDDRTGEYKVKIITSKFDKFLPSGKVVNVTGKNLWDALNLGSKFGVLE